MIKRAFLFFIFFWFYSLLIIAQPSNINQNNKGSINNDQTKSFEGSIKFIQKMFNDTNYYTYHIKNNKVRLDVHENCNDCEELENSMLFDLNKKTITAINPSRKLYINVPTKTFADPLSKNFKIIKSKNNKKIQGYKCYQWRVKNISENTEIAYWVTEDNFDFFEDLLYLWNRSEKHALYFLQIPDIKGFFPLLSVERTALREQKMRLEVVEIIKKPIDNIVFEIPKTYRSYDH